MVNPIPEGFHTLTPYLVVDGASDAIEFYRDAFGAKETLRMPGLDGRLMHAELRIGNSAIMLSDETEAAKGPGKLGGTPVLVHMYVEDADAVFERAVKAGATVIAPLEDQFWGDRWGQLEDPFGHRWSIATHREDLSVSEIMERAPTISR